MRGLCGVYEMSIVTPSQDTGIAITLAPRRRSNFVQTQNVETITRRALAYLNAGFSVHFRGPAGTGKTTLALEVAALLNRPTIMITGDEDMATATLVGSQRGYHYRKVVDRFIHNVTKTEVTAEHHWADHRLTTACREGYTLIYDEFTRSRPEANNVLLSVLEEGLLVLPAQNQNEPYITVHPNFRVIFTSNPQEYAGVHEAQDAFGDRIVTIDMGYADRELEIAIAAARSGLPTASVTPIVDLVQEFRSTGEYDQTPRGAAWDWPRSVVARRPPGIGGRRVFIRDRRARRNLARRALARAGRRPPGGALVKFVRDPRPPRCAPLAPVNFLNPERKVQETKPGTALAWGSVTTGNLAGVDLWLDDASRGTPRLETNVVSGEVELASLRDNLVQSEGGGLGRRLSIYRLPEDDWTRHVAFIHTVSFAEGVADL